MQSRIALAECRRLLTDEYQQFTDQEIEALREQLYALAEAVLAAAAPWVRDKLGSGVIKEQIH